jgi:GTP-binding protein
MPPRARFLVLDTNGSAWPKVHLPQVAFAGRSNVGKSSLLNAFTGIAGLARTSSTPGRTRGVVLFEWEEKFALADLPGYGFAKVSREERASWGRLVEGYLGGCAFLRKVYILVDSRRGPEEEERELAEYLLSKGVPYRWVATKGDKLSMSERRPALARFAGAPWLEGGGEPLLCSVRKGTGIDLLRRDAHGALSGRP